MQVFMTAVDKDANGDYFDLYRNKIRTSASGKKGFNWAIDAPHTTIMPELARCTDNGRLTAGEMPRDARSTPGCSVS